MVQILTNGKSVAMVIQEHIPMCQVMEQVQIIMQAFLDFIK